MVIDCSWIVMSLVVIANCSRETEQSRIHPHCQENREVEFWKIGGGENQSFVSSISYLLESGSKVAGCPTVLSGKCRKIFVGCSSASNNTGSCQFAVVTFSRPPRSTTFQDAFPLE